MSQNQAQDTTTLDTAIEFARLLEVGGQYTDGEYSRGICELLANLFPSDSTDQTSDRADEIFRAITNNASASLY